MERLLFSIKEYNNDKMFKIQLDQRKVNIFIDGYQGLEYNTTTSGRDGRDPSKNNCWKRENNWKVL